MSKTYVRLEDHPDIASAMKEATRLNLPVRMGPEPTPYDGEPVSVRVTVRDKEDK